MEMEMELEVPPRAAPASQISVDNLKQLLLTVESQLKQHKKKN